MMKTGKAGNHGYIVIVCMIAMLIMTLAILVLIDLLTSTKGKIKLQAAADAAAMVGAEWQLKSLNLIGEINLIKATTLITDFGTGADAAEKLADANRNLSEMQFRIACVGPTIGYGAAQQAAKNNGVTVSEDNQTRLSTEITAVDENLDKVDDSTLPWTDWRAPYCRMLNTVYSNGAAASMLPDLVVEPSWLGSEETLLAVLSNNFCRGVNNILGYDDSYWSSGWQHDVKIHPRAKPGQSSALALNIALSNYDLTDPAHQNARNQVSTQISDSSRSWSMLDAGTLPSISFCIFDSTWSRTPSARWNYSYSDEKNRQGILRGEVSLMAKCGGAVSPAICQQDLDLFMNYKPTVSGNTSGDPLNAGGSSSSSEWMSRAKKLMSSGMVTHNSGSSEIRRSSHVTTYAAAKPFSKQLSQLSTPLRPQDIAIVLPVFDTVSLVPFRMYTGGLKSRSPQYEAFLIWLAQNGSQIDNFANLPSSLEIPGRFMPYIRAIQILSSDDKNYRYPRKDENGNIMLDTVGNPIYDDVTFREYGRLWLQDHSCPDPGGNASIDIM